VSDPIGTVLNDTYRLERLLGKGGMGKVYEASHQRLERRFAVKLLVPEAAADEVALSRFHREARITSGLGHPHIVEVVDFNTTEDGEPYIVMEQLEGESLDDRLERDTRLDLPTVASIVRQATSALHVAHEKGVVHRDLKPQNLFLCRRGSRDDYVKLLDFGISKVLGSSSVLTRTNALVGSPGYMSPEQAEEQAEDVDVRCDVYGMGTLIFEMLTGAPPFTASSVPSLLYKIVHQDPPDLCELRPDLPEDVGRVVAIALGKRPEERYGSIEELWQAFSEALEGAKVAYIDRTRVQHTAWPEQARPPGQALAAVSTEELAARRPTEPENPIISNELLESTNATATDERHHATAIANREPGAERSVPATSRNRQRNQVGHSTTLSVSAGELRPQSRRIGPLVAVAAAAVAVLVAGIVTYVLMAGPTKTPIKTRTKVAAGAPKDASRVLPASPVVSPQEADDAALPPAPDAAPSPSLSKPDAAPSKVIHPPRTPKRPKRRHGILIVGTPPINGKHTWANVYIDSVKVGGTPLHRKIKAGYHMVEVRRGSVRKRRRVLIRAGRKTNITFKITAR
jgi:eukaryotic-like serine/threonine-protein kinase